MAPSSRRRDRAGCRAPPGRRRGAGGPRGGCRRRRLAERPGDGHHRRDAHRQAGDEEGQPAARAARLAEQGAEEEAGAHASASGGTGGGLSAGCSSRSTRPSRRWIRRSARAATAGSWVTSTRVVPSRRAQLGQQLQDPAAGGAVEVAGGLVGEQDGRPGGEGAGQRHPLLLAARELARVVMAAVGEAHGGEQLVGAGERVGHGRAARWAAARSPARSGCRGAGSSGRRSRSCGGAAGRARPRTSPGWASPSISTSPEVGRSRPAIRASRVDLPLPEGPRTATNSPGSIARSTRSRMVSSRSAGGEAAGEPAQLDAGCVHGRSMGNFRRVVPVF